MKDERKNTIKLALWTLSWVVTLAVATFGPKFIWDEQLYLTILAVAFNLVIGILMIVANRSYFNNLDELQRKIHLEALAITLGLSMIAGISYSLLDITNLIPMDAEIGFLIGFMGITYLISLFINGKRYL